MCGIAGIIRYGDTLITEDNIALFLTGNEHRGNDATGIAIQQASGHVYVYKKDVPSWKFVSEDAYAKFIKEHLTKDTRVVLMHTRGVSQGNPRDNNNNHPMFAGKSAFVHNGSIKNENSLFNNWKLDQKADTDSDILRAIVDKWGITEEAVKKLAKVEGSVAGAAVSPDYPSKVLLVHSGPPMTLASTKDLFIFSSEKDTIHRAMRPWVERFGTSWQFQTPDLAFSPMPDNTAWILGPRGKELHAECRTLTGPYKEPFRKVYEEYAERSKRFDGGCHVRTYPLTQDKLTVTHGKATKNDMKEAVCSSKECRQNWVIPIMDVYSEYTCNTKKGGCGSVLEMPAPQVN